VWNGIIDEIIGNVPRVLPERLLRVAAAAYGVGSPVSAEMRANQRQSYEFDMAAFC
jgi:hypothetical protein